MDRAGAPFDEEGQQLSSFGFQAQNRPIQNSSVGAPSRAGYRPLNFEALLLKASGKHGNIARMGRPANQRGIVVEGFQAAGVETDWLFGIGRDYF
jgi:hypothetical protein